MRYVLCLSIGHSRFAHAFMWDTGTSVGTLSGMVKPVNNIDVKQTRPYRCVTASEDYSVCYYEGPPFKYKDAKKVAIYEILMQQFFLCLYAK